MPDLSANQLNQTKCPLTGVMTVRSGRWLPPAQGWLLSNTSPRCIFSPRLRIYEDKDRRTSLDACKHSTEAWHCLRPHLHEYGSTTRLHYYRPGNTFIAGSNGIIGIGTGWLVSWYSPVLDDYSLGTNLVMDGYSLSIHMVLDGYSLGTHLVLGGYSLGTHLYWMVTLLVLTCTGRLLTWYSSGIGRLLSWYSPVLDGYSLDTHLYWMVTLLVLTWYWTVTLLVLTCTGWLLSWYSPVLDGYSLGTHLVLDGLLHGSEVDGDVRGVGHQSAVRTKQGTGEVKSLLAATTTHWVTSSDPAAGWLERNLTV